MRRFILPVLCLSASIALAGDPPVKPSDADAKAKVEALKAALKGTDAKAKTDAIAEAGACNHPLTAAALGVVLSDPNEDLRVAAAKALGLMKGSPDAAKSLAAGMAANPKQPAVLIAIFDSMAAVGDRSSVPLLADYAGKRLPQKDDDEGTEIRSAIIALGKLRWKASMDALCDIARKQASIGMSKKDFQTQTLQVTGEALKALSDADFPTAQEYAAWWKKVQDKYNDNMTKK